MNGTDSSLFATGVYGVAKTAAIIIFLVFVADSLGRRWSLLFTSAAQALVLFIIGTYGRVQPPVSGEPVRCGTACTSRAVDADPVAKQVTAFGYVAITCIYLWAAYVTRRSTLLGSNKRD